MAQTMRKSGIPEVGEIALGTHLCHVFETADQLYETVAPFLAAGLAEGELVLWLLAEPITADGAREALRRLVPDVDAQIASRNVILQTAVAWYRGDRQLDFGMIAEEWNALYAEADRRGFSGVRIAGCVSWVPESQWTAFRDYEAVFERLVADQPVIVICSYAMPKGDATRLIDATLTHPYMLLPRDGRRELVVTPAAEVRQLNSRNCRQAAISKLGLAAIRESDLDALMKEAAVLSAEMLGTGRSIIWQLNEDDGEMVLRARAGWEELPGDAAIKLGEGSAARHILTNDQPVLVANVQHDPRFANSWVLRVHKVATLISAIVRGRERPWGLLSVHAMTPRTFDAEDVEFLQSMANVLALAIERKTVDDERARLLETAEEALAKLHAIQNITDTALARMGLDDLLVELLARLRMMLHAECALVLLLDAERTHFVVRAVDGKSHDRVLNASVPVEDSPSAPIARDGKARVFDDLGDPMAYWPAKFGVMVRSMMSAPLVVEGKIIGAVSVTSESPRKFTSDDLELLRVVADRVAPAIERSRLIDSVRAGRERLESLSRRLLTVQEEERRRLAIELHDELGQLLTAVKMNLGASPAHFDDAIESVDLAMQTVRDLALDLRPAMLDDLGLAAALRWYADRFAKQTGIATHLAVDEVPRLDPNIATASFRVAQEALTNVARHASAKNVWLSLHQSNGTLELAVRDDGVGFDVAAASDRATRGASLGLVGMEERASLAGGSLAIVSKPASGAEVRARFPIRSAA
jgi:signal transduction histidine kinase